MTVRELIDCLCELRPSWAEQREAIHERAIYYVDGAQFGHDLVAAALARSTEPWVPAGFAVIERALVEGDATTQNLVVVGLFEAMQNAVYRATDADPAAVDAFLGPKSQRAWADLIEGWTGDGIRSIAQWRCVIINGPRDRIAFTSEALQFVATPHEVAWQRGDQRGRWTPSADDFARIVRPLWPLRAVRQTERAAFGDMAAMIDVDGAQGPAMIMIGGEVDGGRIARRGERWFVVDYAALAASWAWLASGERYDDVSSPGLVTGRFGI